MPSMELLFFSYRSITQRIRLAPKHSAYKKGLDNTDKKRMTNFSGAKAFLKKKQKNTKHEYTAFTLKRFTKKNK